jgi:hypothetical protein
LDDGRAQVKELLMLVESLSKTTVYAYLEVENAEAQDDDSRVQQDIPPLPRKNALHELVAFVNRHPYRVQGPHPGAYLLLSYPFLKVFPALLRSKLDMREPFGRRHHGFRPPGK